MMPRLAYLLCATAMALTGCGGEDDGSVTDDANELNEGRGSLEREMDPPVAIPSSALIGAKIPDVLAKAKGTATALAAKKLGDDCKQTSYKDAVTKKVVLEHLDCKGSDTIRVLGADGRPLEEHFDLNKDGEVDRYAGTEGAVVTYGDGNYDGKIDLLIERVDKVKDFSMKGYDETFPKSRFLHRVREDRDHDGKLDHERLTARGSLPALAQ